jgi:hypothetical protein
MKTFLLIIGVFLISCSKQKIIYKYQYTTQQSEEYRKENKMKNFYVTSLGGYDKILSASEIEAERLRYRVGAPAVVISDTFFITNY